MIRWHRGNASNIGTHNLGSGDVVRSRIKIRDEWNAYDIGYEKSHEHVA